MNKEQFEIMSHGSGFVAALDQSGGSTPGALAAYGLDSSAWSTEEEMFDLVHQMRTRIITSPAFDSRYIIAAILFANTMDRQIEGLSTPEYLWNVKGIIPLLKVDSGLAEQTGGVRLMKPFGDLTGLLAAAKKKGVYGTKMRSVIYSYDEEGICKLLDQQFDYAKQILAEDMVPIIEPEVDIKAAEKEKIEDFLKAELVKRLDAFEGLERVMLKLTLPTKAGLYSDLAAHRHVQRVLALSGGYSRDEACKKLDENPALIASFSRALTEGLTAQMSDAQFNEALDEAVTKIHCASVHGCTLNVGE